MPEISEAVETPKAAPKAKKADKTKTATSAKNGKPARAAGDLGESRLKVLRAAVKGGTLETLIKATKMPERAVYHHLWHLRKDGLVKSERDAEIGEVVFWITAKGSKVASK